ncbi:hypothetical protein FACS1894159_08060 [Bacteroidia bacterium]|nr:hypothetical protein FACS1894159_08060 [Bacteroidia bacterium]
MRVPFKILSLAAMVLFWAGCRGHRTIPDDKLREITKEIFLSNAYLGSYQLNRDSVDIYTPIFGKYGYTVEDFRHTLGEFARRKSSRLGDIVKDAHTDLDKQYAQYQRKLAILDTIDILAGERLKRQVLYDSLIRARRIGDTTRLIRTIRAQEGSYKITFYCLVDSLDQNTGQRAIVYLVDSAGHRTVANTQWMARYQRQRKDVSISVPRTTRKLIIDLGSYPPNAQTPLDLTIDSLTVVYYLPREVALDSIVKLLTDYKLLIDGKEYDRLAPDSLPAVAGPPWDRAQHGGNHR